MILGSPEFRIADRLANFLFVKNEKDPTSEKRIISKITPLGEQALLDLATTGGVAWNVQVIDKMGGQDMSGSPEPPCYLRWNGKRIQIGGPPYPSKKPPKPYNISWLLLKFFWDRETASYAELQNGVDRPWRTAVDDQTIRSAINRFNNEAWPWDFPWKLCARDGFVSKVHR